MRCDGKCDWAGSDTGSGVVDQWGIVTCGKAGRLVAITTPLGSTIALILCEAHQSFAQSKLRWSVVWLDDPAIDRSGAV